MYTPVRDFVFTSINTAAYDNTVVLCNGVVSMAPFAVFWQASDLSKFDVDYASLIRSTFSP